MKRLARDSLLSLEAYARQRDELRAAAIAYKKGRRLALGAHVSLLFEDEVTVRYQVQEMLRAERIFDEADIRAEIATYEGLLPDGANWKATMLIEFADAHERRVQLVRLLDVEHRVWVRVGGGERVFAIADEGLPRVRADKTAAVHFLRFELGGERVRALRAGAALAFGIDHPHYHAEIDPLPAALRASLCADFHE